MTWTKLSDDYSDDTWALSDAAFRLHTEALVWSNRKLLDCVIPKDDLRRFAKSAEPVQELLDGDYWLDAGQAYVIAHHAQYQRDRKAVIQQQAANRANGGKGGRPAGKPREQKTQSVNDSQSDGKSGGFQNPPSRPDPKTLENTGQQTQSVSEWPSDSKTKRDGPGIEGEYPSGNSDWTPEMDSAWKSYEPAPVGPSMEEPLLSASNFPDPSSMESVFCHGCGQELETWEGDTVAGHCLDCSGDCSNCFDGSDYGEPVPGAVGGPAAGPGGCSVPGCAGLVTEYLLREYGPVCMAHVGAVVS